MLSKVINKINYENFKVRRILIMKINALLRHSDKNRWSNKKALHTNWDERTKMLVAYVKPNSKVFEFGAGRLSLEKMLPEGCTYFHSDIVKRNADTLVIDLNQELPEIPKVDYVIFSGVLEYVFDIRKVLMHIEKNTDAILFSYATTNSFMDINTRRSHGCVSDFCAEDFEQIAERMNRKIEVINYWKGQTPYLLN